MRRETDIPDGLSPNSHQLWVAGGRVSVLELAAAPSEFSSPEPAATITVPFSHIFSITQKVDRNITHEAILASTPEGAYGRPFGRDSAIVAQFAIAMHRMESNSDRFSRIVSAIRNMGSHIATEDVLEAGIQKGKMVHEAGTEGYPSEWYRDKEGIGRNYDSLDATSRHVLVINEILDIDPRLTSEFLPFVELMTEWEIRNTKDFGGAAFIPAELDADRTYPGLFQQRWRDCRFSTVGEDGEIPTPPIYPVEEQALRWASLSAAADLLADTNPHLSQEAKDTAAFMKKMFMDEFVYEDERGIGLADALDGHRNQAKAVTIDHILALGATYKGDSIIDDPELREKIIARAFEELYTPAGLRTISPQSKFHPESVYHGPRSIWPHAQGLAVMAIHKEAMRNKEVNDTLYEKNRARVIKLSQSLLGTLVHFGSPIESIQISDDGEVELYGEIDERGEKRTCPTEQTWAGLAGEYVANLLENEYNMHEVVVPVFSSKSHIAPRSDVFVYTA